MILISAKALIATDLTDRETIEASKLEPGMVLDSPDGDAIVKSVTVNTGYYHILMAAKGDDVYSVPVDRSQICICLGNGSMTNIRRMPSLAEIQLEEGTGRYFGHGVSENMEPMIMLEIENGSAIYAAAPDSPGFICLR